MDSGAGHRRYGQYAGNPGIYAMANLWREIKLAPCFRNRRRRVAELHARTAGVWQAETVIRRNFAAYTLLYTANWRRPARV